MYGRTTTDDRPLRVGKHPKQGMKKKPDSGSDFTDINLSDVTESDTQYGTAKRSTLENGEPIISRPGGSDGAPAIERQANIRNTS